MTKVCSPTKGCGIEKDIEEFPVIKTGNKQKYRYLCKKCFRLKANEWSKLWKRKNKNTAKELLQRSKRSARENNLEHTIELKDIQIPEYCPLLGTKLLSEGTTKKNSSPSLDRLDSSKGYVKGNINVISWRANSLKHDATLEELEKLVNGIKKLKLINKNVSFIECDQLKKNILRMSKDRARKKNREHNLKIEDIKIPTHCPILGIELRSTLGNKSRNYHTPSIDRINPDRGYLADNIAIISWRANNLKKDATLEELEKLVEGLKKLHNYRD